MPKAAEQENDLDEDQDPDQTEIKAEPERRQHVPYILNGELYRIESQIGDNVTVKCCYCPPDRIYRGSVRSTGNFHMHIKRRHASLLGKLHEMKVAALVERRDRIMKNRSIAKYRKKSTTPIANVVAVLAEAAGTVLEEVPSKRPETRELKIKTVFQRHKQEHEEQEEAAAIRTSVSMSESSLDNNSESSEKLSSTSKQDNNNNTNNNVQLLQNVNNLSNVSPGVLNNTLDLNQNVGVSTSLPTNDATDLPSLAGMQRILPINHIKPEQQNQTAIEQPEAIDLSRTSSLQSYDTIESNSVENVQTEVSRAQELAPFVNGPPREVLQRIDNTLADIKFELQARNQIERKRLQFDMAKFQYLHPNFNYDATQ